MKIALDYDGTYTEDPALWDAFISNASRRGHEVTFVTMRHKHEPIEVSHPTIYTCRNAKKAFTEKLGIIFDIWIDDNPHWLFQDG